MLTFEPHTPDNVVVGHASGKLTHEDYENFRWHVEEMIHEHGSVRVMLELSDFHGWEPRAAWDDIQLGLHYPGKFERCAILGDRSWQGWMVQLAKPFFRVEYFDRSQRETAWRWLMQSVPQTAFLSDLGCFARKHPMMSLLVSTGLMVLLVRQLGSSRSRRWAISPYGQ
ncbi:MAG TPA: STAS/SEC14 domain-containing protein [Gemmataceae bacterium]|nr:STAS/SEC14 domain-containing protein [Gemmataceae bacterium]